MSSYPDPFDTLFALQRALDARLASDWMGAGTTAGGSYPPVNIFQQGDDFVLVVELPGVAKSDLSIEAKETRYASLARKRSNTKKMPAYIGVNASVAASTARSRFRSK